MDQYKESHAFFWKKLVPHHEKVIRKLINLRNEIQARVEKQKELRAIFSLNGIVGGGILLGGLFLSPVSGGGSFLAAVGGAYGMVFGGLEVANDIASTASINQKLNEAQECLEDHGIVLKEMYDYLEEMHYYTKEGAKPIGNDEQRDSKNKSTNKKSSIAVIGIILFLKAILPSSNDLSKIEKGKLCDQAKCLDKAIEDLENEFEMIRKVLKVQINPF